jgi:MFS transporter, DHA1 family, inner membrane transport protein
VSFLRNRAVNLVNLHYSFTSLAMAGGGVFFGSYLLRAGVPAPAVLGALALIVACRFVVRPSVLALGRRFGLKRLLIVGTVGSALQYPLLAEVHGVGRALVALCLVAAIGDTFYWTCYHAYFASVGDREHRGQQIAAREAFASAMAIVGPLVIGAMLVTLGPRAAFGATAAIQALAALPLLLTPEVHVLREAPGSFRAALRGASMFAIDGWISASYVFVWQIALFLSLGESFSRFGAAMAFAALVGAAGGLLLGRHIDAGHGHHATWLALGGLSANIIFRALSTRTPALGVIANACGALEGCLYQTTIMTVVYNQAKASPCALRFHIAAEGAWDVGFGTGCLTAAALLLLGAPLSSAILLSVAGIPPLFGLMHQHFADERGPSAYRVSSETG